MKFLKYLFVTVLVIIVVMVIVSFFLPRKVHVERSTVINAPREVIFEQVNNLKNWSNWSPWHKIDTLMEITYEGPEEGNGAGYSWKSEHPNVGNGRLAIASSVPFDSIFTKLWFTEGDPAHAGYYFKEEAEGVRVTWTMDMDNGFNPIGRWFSLFMKEYIEKDYDKGLATLKEFTEALPPKSPWKIALETMPSIKAFTYLDTTTVYELESGFTNALVSMYITLDQNQIKASGPRFAIYHLWSDDTVIVEYAIPVEQDFSVPAGYSIREFPAMETLTSEARAGVNTEPIHYAMYDEARARNLEISGAPWEIYVVDKSDSPDSSAWLTRIVYPVN